MSESKAIEKKLADLQPGDKVVHRSGLSRCPVVKEVKRVTNTQIIVGGAMAGTELRFRKENGRAVGYSHHYPSRIVVASEQELDNVRLEYRMNVITNFRFVFNGNDPKLVNEIYEWLLGKEFIAELEK